MSGSHKDAQQPDLGEVLDEVRRQVGDVALQFREAFAKVQDEAQYRVDKEIGRQMAKHPELFADIRRAMRQAKRSADKAFDSLTKR